MKNSDYQERRAFRRFNIRIPVTCIDPATDETLRGQTYDISAEGIGIITYKELPAGTPLLINLDMTDNGEEVQAKGRVIWSVAVDSANYRVGVKLEEKKLKPIDLVLRIVQTLIKSVCLILLPQLYL